MEPAVDISDHAHKKDSYYIIVALVLAVFTAIETSTYFWNYGHFAIWVLLAFMIAKFFTVVRLFMHLKFDSKLFSAMFYTGLVLAVGVYITMLLTFRVFSKS